VIGRYLDSHNFRPVTAGELKFSGLLQHVLLYQKIKTVRRYLSKWDRRGTPNLEENLLSIKNFKHPKKFFKGGQGASVEKNDRYPDS